MNPSNPESLQRRQLSTMRSVATTLLLLMAALFVVARQWQEAYPQLEAVAAFAEAAMVGALADWFAVTALFRYPLGLRIPHTAIIPNNKDRIARNLGLFVEQNFFSVTDTPHRDLCRTLAQWLVTPGNSSAAARRLIGVVDPLITLFRETPLKTLIEHQLTRSLKAIDWAPLLGDLFAALLHSKQQQLLLDEILQVSRRALADNRSLLNERLNQVAPWFIPNFVSDRLSHRILERLDTFFDEVTSRPDHPARLRLIATLEQFALQLKNSAEYKEKISAIRDELLESAIVRRSFDSIQEIILSYIAADMNESDSSTQRAMAELLSSLGHSLLNDEALRQRTNAFLHRVLLTLVNSEHSSLSESIAATVRSWDTLTLVEKLELQVGRDLQFIRINGTIVGGCVGLALYYLTHLLSP